MYNTYNNISAHGLYMKIYFISLKNDIMENTNNYYNPLLKSLLLYDKHISIANDIIDSDFIIIDCHLSNKENIGNFKKIKNKFLKFKNKTIFFIYAPIEETSRTTYYNTDSIYDELFDDNYIYFTILNVHSRENIIYVPLGPVPPNMINGNYLANIELFKTIAYNNKIYFRGSPTHIVRNIVCEYFKKRENCNIKLHENINYFWNGIQSANDTNHYYDHISNCINSDINLLIRGDRDFCYVFCDYLYCGNIICFVNADLYKYVGLEKFGLDKIFYFFDINNTSLESIYNTLSNVLKNKDKIIEDKIKIKHFYDTFIKVDKAYSIKYSYSGGYNGFTHFIIYKMYEIINNDYKLNDNKILNPNAINIVD